MTPPRPQWRQPRFISVGARNIDPGRYRLPGNDEHYRKRVYVHNFWNQGVRVIGRPPNRFNQIANWSNIPRSHNKVNWGNSGYPKKPWTNVPNDKRHLFGKFHQGTLDRVAHKNDTRQPKHDRRSNNHKQNSETSDQVKLNVLVEKMFELLRSHHHLEKVLVDNDMGPPTFRWLTRYLGEVVRPAKITPETKTLLEGNAKNWAYTNRLILQDHYAGCIDREADELQGLMVTNWEPAFTRAEKKYQNKYGKRQEKNAIEKVRAILTVMGDKPVLASTPEQVPTPEQNPAPIEVNQREEQMSDDTEFPPLAHKGFSSSPSSNPPTPSRPTSITTGPRGTPPRSPRVPRRNQVVLPKPIIRKQNPAVINVRDVPELSEIGLYTGTQESNRTTMPTGTRKPQQVPGGVGSQIVVVHPETLNPELKGATVQEPQSKRGEIGAQGPEEREALLIDISPSSDSPLCTPANDGNTNLSLLSQLTPTWLSDPPGTSRPTRHRLIQRKMMDWSLNVKKKWCIIGDQNLGTIPAHEIKDLQIDSYPGATFRHAEAFVSRANTLAKVQVIVLAFGINHRVQKRKETGVKELQRAVKATKEKFPHASVWIPLINHSKTLPVEEQLILRELNAHVKRNMLFLPALPDTKFQVGEDQIQWTPACAKAMLQHWAEHLNF